MLKNETIVIPKQPRPLLDGVYLAVTFGADVITAILARLNRAYDDYELRGETGEWTREEAGAELQAGIDCQERNKASGEFWHREVE